MCVSGDSRQKPFSLITTGTLIPPESCQAQMQAASADPRGPEPGLETSGIPAGLRRNPPTTTALGKFAQSMAESIIQPCVSQLEMEEPEVPGSNQDQGTLGEVVVEVALREVCAGLEPRAFPQIGRRHDG
ncbi:unnamed protein product [Pleuronectes platessa]|uniref:Uncharacterized protein n=1 Tax=Pleuronectes platessa TaxID=8262 RepID=A0A9N7YRQ0_PLEPL|nr:unnamed protein product [Pleuronectes platessa]